MAELAAALPLMVEQDNSSTKIWHSNVTWDSLHMSSSWMYYPFNHLQTCESMQMQTTMWPLMSCILDIALSVAILSSIAHRDPASTSALVLLPSSESWVRAGEVCRRNRWHVLARAAFQ